MPNEKVRFLKDKNGVVYNDKHIMIAFLNCFITWKCDKNLQLAYQQFSNLDYKDKVK